MLLTERSTTCPRCFQRAPTTNDIIIRDKILSEKLILFSGNSRGRADTDTGGLMYKFFEDHLKSVYSE